MRILYLSLSYVPSRRASSVQVMKMCAALGRAGHEVVLVAKDPPAPAAGAGSDFEFYGVEPCFRLEKLPRPQRTGGGAVFAAATARRVAAYRRWADLVYCRDPLGGAMVGWLGLPFVFEAHQLPHNRLQVALWRQMIASRRFLAMVAISDALRRDIQGEGYLDARDCIVAHDAADVPVRTPAPRQRRPGERPRIGYVGNLYKGRGIDLVLELARRMPDCQFDLVGGAEKDLQAWRATRPPDNAVFHGFHPPSRLGEFYSEFDVVVMPHGREGVVGAGGRSDISRWTSPMKMFEYLASGVALVASNLPVLQEVLRHGENAFIARAGDPDDWMEKIRALLDDPDLRLRLARTAQEDLVRSHTWDARARHVVNLLPGTGSARASAPGPLPNPPSGDASALPAGPPKGPGLT
jgi:glycosyltransferase involved in cell wall biosynthesis